MKASERVLGIIFPHTGYPFGFRILFCCNIAVLSLVTYNWLINLSAEIDLFWSVPTKGASLFYFAMRYMAYFEPVFTIFNFYPMSDKFRCKAVYWVHSLVTPAIYIAPAMFSANRAYALSNQVKLLYWTVLTLALGPVIVNLVDSFLWVRPANLPPPLYCSARNSTPLHLNIPLLLASKLSVTVADLIVVIITWGATYKTLREVTSLMKVSLTQVLLFNADTDADIRHPEALYFIVLLLLNVGQIVLTTLSIEALLQTTSYLSFFTDPLMSILATDFLLNLQKAYMLNVTSQATLTGDAISFPHPRPTDHDEAESLSLNFATLTIPQSHISDDGVALDDLHLEEPW
ncbi:hypothetical protein C8Q73DRAFT_667351 [Cubamyces lactineus]|nr:hypothetical protein C8Q73DRAFT_667351 [Cubamyces lactineus]